MAKVKIWFYGIGPFLLDTTKDAPIKIEGATTDDVLLSDVDGNFNYSGMGVENLSGVNASTPNQNDILYFDSGGWNSATLSEANIAAASQLHDRLHTMSGVTNHSAGAFKVFWSDTDGYVNELSLGASGKYLMSNGISDMPSWETGTGGTVAHADTTGQTVNDHHAQSHNVASHSDVIGSPTSAYILEGNGSSWVSVSKASAGISLVGHGHSYHPLVSPTVTNSYSLIGGEILNFVNGVLSSVS